MGCLPTCMGQRPTFIAMMFLTTTFFFVEIIVGYATNSMALVADSFHMLSDIISLFVGYFALKFSQKSNPNSLDANTFGWVRAEVLGALVNAVFLVALCFSILIEALKRLVEPEGIKDPLLILAVGAGGLLINVIGMFLFHGHTGDGHSHGGGSHSHSHGGGNSGHSHEGGDSHKKGNNHKKKHKGHNNKAYLVEEKVTEHETAVVPANQKVEQESDVRIDMFIQEPNNTLPPINETAAGKKQPKGSGQMNMKGVYLHILGDALGSVIVIIAALLIHFFDAKWTLYVDPVMSIIMVGIILKTSIPLLKESSLILLQYVPAHIQLKQLEERLLGAFPEIIAVHEFHVWQLTGNKIVASLHIMFPLNADYKLVSASVKEFFHDEGIHSTTVQPEFLEDHRINEKQCILRCLSKTCEEKLCCKTPASEKEKLLPSVDDPIEKTIHSNSSHNNSPNRSIKKLSGIVSAARGECENATDIDVITLCDENKNDAVSDDIKNSEDNSKNKSVVMSVDVLAETNTKL